MKENWDQLTEEQRTKVLDSATENEFKAHICEVNIWRIKDGIQHLKDAGFDIAALELEKRVEIYLKQLEELNPNCHAIFTKRTNRKYNFC